MTANAASWPAVDAAEGWNPSSQIGESVEEFTRRTLAAIWSCEGRSLRLSVWFCGDAELRDLHARFLDDDSVTDVISFPLEEPADPEVAAHHAQGELVVSVECAIARAAEYANPLRAELALYLVHGALHLLGYDDHDADERLRMLAAERRVLETLGYRVHDRYH